MTDQFERRFIIRRQLDGSFTVSGDHGLPTFTMFLTGGWPHVQELRHQHRAKDHFPVTADFDAFCETFGPPPEDASASER